MAFSGIGLAPDSGVSWTLQRLVGPGRRPRAAAARRAGRRGPGAASSGWSTGWCRTASCPRSRASWPGRLAAGPTAAYAATKRALDFAAAHTLDEALELEAELQEACAATEDHRAPREAFLEKRRPDVQRAVTPARSRTQQSARWSLTRPIACMSA